MVPCMHASDIWGRHRAREVMTCRQQQQQHRDLTCQHRCFRYMWVCWCYRARVYMMHYFIIVSMGKASTDLLLHVGPEGILELAKGKSSVLFKKRKGNIGNIHESFAGFKPFQTIHSNSLTTREDTMVKYQQLHGPRCICPFVRIGLVSMTRIP